MLTKYIRHVLDVASKNSTIRSQFVAHSVFILLFATFPLAASFTTAWGSTKIPSHRMGDADFERCMNLLEKSQYKVIVFDMDLTAVAMHSRGTMRRDSLDKFLGKISPDFAHLVPMLHKNGFKVAMATHSDEAEYDHGRLSALVNRETHIMGHELVLKVLEHVFEDGVVKDIPITAYNPRARGTLNDTENQIKRYHMRKIMNHFGVPSSEILFFDDTPTVVKDCNEHVGVKTIQVDRRTAFTLQDMIGALTEQN